MPSRSHPVAAWYRTLAASAACFTPPSFVLFCELSTAWILCPGRRTVTRMIGLLEPRSRRAHDDHGVQALYWLFFAAYNLLTLFLYLKLQSCGRDCGLDRTRTTSRFVDEMFDDLARLNPPLWDTS